MKFLAAILFACVAALALLHSVYGTPLPLPMTEPTSETSPEPGPEPAAKAELLTDADPSTDIQPIAGNSSVAEGSNPVNLENAANPVATALTQRTNRTLECPEPINFVEIGNVDQPGSSPAPLDSNPINDTATLDELVEDSPAEPLTA